MARQSIRLRVADLAARHLEVEHTVAAVGGGTIVLRMPVWCPGSYLVREYAGHVSRFEAWSGEERLVHRKLDKASWEITCPGGGDVTVRYRVYAPELTVRTNDVDHEHAFVHPPATFCALEGHADEAIDLIVEAPEGWTVTTALPHDRGVYRARDFDHLADSPLEIGRHALRTFEVAGRPHEFALHGEGNADLDRIVADTEKIVRAEIDFFGGEPPYDRYLFVLHQVPARGGGLEHDDSCVLAWPKLGFRPESEYRKFLTLVAHEFFHVWNVRRIRPEALMRYDYQRENPTRLLWVFEGFTVYYDELFPMRAGCYGPKEMLAHLAEHVALEASRPGGRFQSLEESSFDAWIGLYRPTPDTPNAQTNYYLKGMLVAWALDQHLREHTGDARSLDDVMRHLWTEYGARGRGVGEDGMASIVEAATGVDVTDFLREHVETPGRMDHAGTLARLGLRLRRKSADDDAPPAWFGAKIESRDDGARLVMVTHEGPAHAGGLMADDVVIALDGHRVGRDFDKRLTLHTPGDVVEWTAFRRDRLVQGRVTLGEDPVGDLEIVPVEAPSDAQHAAFRAWTGHELAALDADS